ncbi:hypothetical protein PHYSODRAFT_331466 [Phytophthora sojae]|uniref:Uncharacterized protein n=1 Tax=Phytophthora sojae (strain P6497) TaxID=1094619 RepID=G4ZFI5_PHYSP|nr:hypothetical protein PHYSODRAFT_331466 [Phytophthora sojae]EGZ17501.1 hypothetical protein PHYSODRAFT_331466 [Phytophthora sojae]|eukprot:XP_009526559.1 hypothetical protein PHYSODRAFT_331466 [Phytophthora sojae]
MALNHYEQRKRDELCPGFVDMMPVFSASAQTNPDGGDGGPSKAEQPTRSMRKRAGETHQITRSSKRRQPPHEATKAIAHAITPTRHINGAQSSVGHRAVQSSAFSDHEGRQYTEWQMVDPLQVTPAIQLRLDEYVLNHAAQRN